MTGMLTLGVSNHANVEFIDLLMSLHAVYEKQTDEKTRRLSVHRCMLAV